MMRFREFDGRGEPWSWHCHVVNETEGATEGTRNTKFTATERRNDPKGYVIEDCRGDAICRRCK
jgi:hypothetical protein